MPVPKENLDFRNTKILGVSVASRFIGGDVFRLSTTQTISIEGFIRTEDDEASWDGISQVNQSFGPIQSQIDVMKEDFLKGEKKGYTDIELNGVPVGNGRVLSLDFPSSKETTENSIAFGKYNATIELYKKASSLDSADGFVNDQIPDLYDEESINKIHEHALNIEEFSENFTFNVTEDDAYNYSQEISISLRKSSSEDTESDNFGVSVAQEIVGVILGIERQLNAKLGLIDDRYKEYLTKIEGTAFFSENYNSVRGEYTFSRNLSILPSYTEGAYYSAKITHAIAMNNSGIFNIVESGEIKGMKGHSVDSRYTKAKDGADILISEASDRCEIIYDKYRGSPLADQGYDIPTTKSQLSPIKTGSTFNKPIRTSKRFNPLAGTVSYDIEFTNDPKILHEFIHEYTIEASRDSANVTTVVQRGTIIPYQDKNRYFDSYIKTQKDNFDTSMIPTFNNKIAFSAIEVEINNFYEQVMDDPNVSLSEYQMTSSSVSYPKWGISISYSKTFSDDEAILDPAKNNGVKRLSLRYSNGAPIRLKSAHLIPNVKENIYDADQISLGERSISINAIVERDFDKTNKIGKETQDQNNGKDAITFQRAKLNTGLTKIIKEAQVNLLFTNSKHIRPKSYDIYPTQCNYSINSDNQIEFTLGAEYVFKDGRQIKDLDSFFIKDK
jgi:hypothetical protein